MHTTVDIEDGTFADVRAYANRRGLSFSQALTELLKRALAFECPIEMRDGIPVLTPGPDAPVMTDEDVRWALNE